MTLKRSFQLALLSFALVLPSGITTAQLAPPQLSRRTEPASPLVVPMGAIIPLEIKNTINSRTAFVGEVVYCESIFPVTQDDRMLIPAHSFVKGTVTQVIRPGKIKGKAQLGLRFDSLTLPDGTTRSIKARVFSIAGSRLDDTKGGVEPTEQSTGENLAAGGAKDAIIDATGLGGASPLSAASQGMEGLVLMLVTRGKTIILRPGTTMEISLTSPIDFSRHPSEQTTKSK